jgi:hypothetical protein
VSASGSPYFRFAGLVAKPSVGFQVDSMMSLFQVERLSFKASLSAAHAD